MLKMQMGDLSPIVFERCRPSHPSVLTIATSFCRNRIKRRISAGEEQSRSRLPKPRPGLDLGSPAVAGGARTAAE